MGCPFKFLNIFNRKKDITFYSKIPFGESVFPIEEANKLERKWKASAKEQFIYNYNTFHPAKRVSSVHRCPGINGLLDMGFIVKAHRDINIETVGDNETIRFWNCNELSENNKNDTGLFPPEWFGDHIGTSLPVGAIKTLFKIHVPYNFTVPKDVIFLVNDVPYKEDNRFQTVPGVMDPYFTNELTFIFYWFVKEGVETIKRGTPIAQLIPIKRSKPYTSWNLKSATNELKQKVEACKHSIFGSRITNYDKLKQVSKKLFNY